MRQIDEKQLSKLCAYRFFRYDRDSHCSGDFYCKADNEKLCEYQCSEDPDTINVYPTGDVIIQKIRPQGKWVDYSEEGFIECPFCHKATTCEDNIDELHFCWNCGAKLGKGGAE